MLHFADIAVTIRTSLRTDTTDMLVTKVSYDYAHCLKATGIHGDCQTSGYRHVVQSHQHF